MAELLSTIKAKSSPITSAVEILDFFEVENENRTFDPNLNKIMAKILWKTDDFQVISVSRVALMHEYI